MKKIKLSQLTIIESMSDTAMLVASSGNNITLNKIATSLKNNGYYKTSVYTSDLNELIAPGEYVVNGAPNAPITTPGMLTVRVFNTSIPRYVQEFIADNGVIYRRTKISYSGNWSAWV